MITYEYMILIINNLKISLIVIEPLYDGFDTSLISNTEHFYHLHLSEIGLKIFVDKNNFSF